MDISVVLCTYNNAERLRITLQSFCQLNELEELDWELVTVDNNSTDNTETVIKSFDDRLPIRYVYEREQGLSRARNAGLDVAEGELIVFTDDDVKPHPDWLVAYWGAYLECRGSCYFGGPIVSEFEGEAPKDDLLKVAMPSVAGLDHGETAREISSPYDFVGANWACPKRHLRKAGSFNQSIGLNADDEGISVGEESDMMHRLQGCGLRGWYVPEAKIRHYVPAEKCTTDHIIERRSANIKELYASGVRVPSTLMGVPIGLYKEAARYLATWLTKWALQSGWRGDYVEWRLWVKRIWAYHQARKGKISE